MKKINHYMFLAVAAGFMAFSNHSGQLPIGAPIPKADLKIMDISGKEISLSAARGENGLLVMFSCNTCPYVIRNQEATRQSCAYALEKNIGVVLLNSNEAQRNDGDSFNDMKEYAREQGYKWYYALDKDHVLADAFDASRTPECFLFNKEGKLVYHGAINDNPSNPSDARRQHLQEAVNEMLSGKDVTLKITRSVGCGIKRNS